MPMVMAMMLMMDGVTTGDMTMPGSAGVRAEINEYRRQQRKEDKFFHNFGFKR